MRVPMVKVGLLAILIGAVSAGRAEGQIQGRPPLAEFVIVVTATPDQLTFTCKGSCAWTKLSFNMSVGSAPLAIDDRGMSVVDGANNTGAESGKFRFTVERRGEELRFRASRGTAWTMLAFSCPASGCTQAIDQHGMSEARSR